MMPNSLHSIWLPLLLTACIPTWGSARPALETSSNWSALADPAPSWYRHAQLDLAEALQDSTLPPVGEVFRLVGGNAELRLAAEPIQVVVNPEPHSALIWLTVVLGLVSGSYAYTLRREPIRIAAN